MGTHAHAHTNSTRIHRCARMRMRIRIAVHTVDAADASNIIYIYTDIYNGWYCASIHTIHRIHTDTQCTPHTYTPIRAHTCTRTRMGTTVHIGIHTYTVRRTVYSRTLVDCTTYNLRGTIYEIRWKYIDCTCMIVCDYDYVHYTSYIVRRTNTTHLMPYTHTHSLA